jgi:hypothetical protein
MRLLSVLNVESDLNSLVKRSAGLAFPAIWRMEISLKRRASRMAFLRILTCLMPLVLDELDQSTDPRLLL